jgi:hypothetical protein
MVESGTNEIVGDRKGAQPRLQVGGHFVLCRCGARRKLCERAGDCEQVLDPVVHLAGKHLAQFLGHLAHRDVDEDAIHDAIDDALIVASAASGHPANVIAVQDTKLVFIRPRRLPRRREGRAHLPEVGWVNMGGQLLERRVVIRHAPNRTGAVVDIELVRVDVPGPKTDPGGFRRHPQSRDVPDAPAHRRRPAGRTRQAAVSADGKRRRG